MAKNVKTVATINPAVVAGLVHAGESCKNVAKAMGLTAKRVNAIVIDWSPNLSSMDCLSIHHRVVSGDDVATIASEYQTTQEYIHVVYTNVQKAKDEKLTTVATVEPTEEELAVQTLEAELAVQDDGALDVVPVENVVFPVDTMAIPEAVESPTAVETPTVVEVVTVPVEKSKANHRYSLVPVIDDTPDAIHVATAQKEADQKWMKLSIDGKAVWVTTRHRAMLRTLERGEAIPSPLFLQLKGKGWVAKTDGVQQLTDLGRTVLRMVSP